MFIVQLTLEPDLDIAGEKGDDEGKRLDNDATVELPQYYTYGMIN